MITHIEIDGFKSFYNFSIDLKPFQVIIGHNGVGKSNLFDAIRLLSDLVRYDRVAEAFIQNRGDVLELFSVQADGNRTTTMTFAAEMLIGKAVTDEGLGTSAEVSSTRLRYDLTIERQNTHGLEMLRVTHESLQAITEDDDKWFKSHIPTSRRSYWIKRGRRAPYISTDEGRIYRHQEGSGGRKQETPLGQIERTILSTIDTTHYPTAYAARQEMLNWRFLQFSPSGLRSPSSIYDNGEQLLPDGSNLAAVLFRMNREDEDALADISRDMVNAVPGIRCISSKLLKERNEFQTMAQTQDGEIFSSSVLSDGTLRLLALVTLKNDPRYKGVLTFEEPENGVAPQAVRQALEVLRSLATDFDNDVYVNEQPRQVLMNTHSPYLLTYVALESFLFAYMGGKSPRATHMEHVQLTHQPELLPAQRQQWLFTLDQIIGFMEAGQFDAKIDELRQQRKAVP